MNKAKIIQRLTAECAAAFLSGHTQGGADGAEAAEESLSRTDLRAIADRYFDSMEDLLRERYGETYDDEWWSEIDAEACNSGDRESYYNGWEDGFREAVSHVWQEIKSATFSQLATSAA
jgi:hypothetical protein